MSFPSNFVWGAAAASYQIEGGAYDDGKGLSVWDVGCRRSGKIWDGNTGEVSCDHYHHFRDDVSLMAQIGLKAYRLSISWPRVLPEGTGAVNEAGIDFYDRLVDALCEQEIEPWVTLFHWDYPYALYQRGGWLNRDSACWFAEYAQIIAERLSDRVRHWMTLNEPQCFIGGMFAGGHAPFNSYGLTDTLLAAHHTLMAHGLGVQAIRAQARSQPLVGATPVGIIKVPATDSLEDVETARKATFSITVKNCWNNTWFTDPMMLGSYPKDGLTLFEDAVPCIRNGDLATICQPLDFYGVNIYHGETVRTRSGGGWDVLPLGDGPALTSMEWPVTPEVLYWGPRFLYERYGLPVYITENGMANNDWVHLDGKIHDPQRIDFLSRYLRQLNRASTEGIPCGGYFLWSIMDNFEWSHGYKRRFGIIHIDYETHKRTLKDSALWYRDVIASNGACLL